MRTHTQIYSSLFHRSKKTEKESLRLIKKFQEVHHYLHSQQRQSPALIKCLLCTCPVTLGQNIMQFKMYVSSAPSAVAPGPNQQRPKDSIGVMQQYKVKNYSDISDLPTYFKCKQQKILERKKANSPFWNLLAFPQIQIMFLFKTSVLLKEPLLLLWL